MKKYIFLLLVCFSACTGDKSAKLVEKDFTSYDFPIKIKAPDSIEVKKSDLGFMLDLTVKGKDNYHLQIFSNDATTSDIKSIVEEKKVEAKTNPFFTKIVEENDNGFIFEKQVDSTRINYDFRVVRIQGNKEYTFQTALIGKFTLEEVQLMFEAVQ